MCGLRVVTSLMPRQAGEGAMPILELRRGKYTQREMEKHRHCLVPRRVDCLLSVAASWPLSVSHFCPHFWQATPELLASAWTSQRPT